MNIEDRRFTSLKVLLLLAIFTIASVAFCFKILAPSLAKNDEEREIEDKIPKHLPLKVKLKKEKEEKVKDFKNDQWVREFELEVTNTSEKPIYYLSMYVLLPEFIGPSGGVRGMPLRYGRMDFVKHDTRPLPDDVPIKPGETYTFKIPETDQQGWYDRQARGPVTNPRKLQFIFSGLSFGDGTGFVGTTGVPYPRVRQISQSEIDARCLERRAQKQGGDIIMMRFAAPSSSLPAIVGTLAEEDLYRAVNMARNIAHESPRAIALLAAPRSTFEQRPNQKKP